MCLPDRTLHLWAMMGAYSLGMHMRWLQVTVLSDWCACSACVCVLSGNAYATLSNNGKFAWLADHCGWANGTDRHPLRPNKVRTVTVMVFEVLFSTMEDVGINCICLECIGSQVSCLTLCSILHSLRMLCVLCSSWSPTLATALLCGPLHFSLCCSLCYPALFCSMSRFSSCAIILSAAYSIMFPLSCFLSAHGISLFHVWSPSAQSTVWSLGCLSLFLALFFTFCLFHSPFHHSVSLWLIFSFTHTHNQSPFISSHLAR